MCGIFCAITTNNLFQQEDFDKFVEITNIVSYRGPDASNCKAYNTRPNTSLKDGHNIFLGHRRLSIIDLSNHGIQPMNAGGSWIVFNGEIFNYIELRSELIKKGHSFITGTDTEVIQKLYLEYGINGFSKLNGMWAFIILDIKNNKLVVSRDRFSIKPLFYYKNSGRIYFASEIKQLLPILDTKDINKKVMYNFLSRGFVDYNNESFFRNIYKVKPKHTMFIDISNLDITEKRYWNYQIRNIYNYNQAKNEFKELLIDSINIRLRSDVEVGCLLSGGLDSSTIAMVANQIDKSIQSFSVISNDKKYSEENFIDILVKSKKILNTKLIFNVNQVLNNIDEVLYYQDEPFESFSPIAQYLIFKKIKNVSGIKVVLSGQGGDEICMGYLKYFFYYLNELWKSHKYPDFFNEIFSSIINRTLIWEFNIKEAKRYFNNMNLEYIKLDNECEIIDLLEYKENKQILDMDNFSIPHLARIEDRNSMSNSIETRLPFLDHRLVNHCLSIPTAFKIKNGWSKYILRNSFNKLPKQIKFRRDKKGFSTPDEYWIRNQLKSKVTELMKNSLLDEMGFIDKTIFMDKYDNYCRGNSFFYNYKDFIRVYLSEIWIRNHFI